MVEAALSDRTPGETFEHVSADEAFIIVRVPILSDTTNVLRLLDSTVEVPSNDADVGGSVLTEFTAKPDDFVFTFSDDRFEIIGDEVRVKKMRLLMWR